MSDANINTFNKFEAAFTAPILAEVTKIPKGVNRISNVLNLQWKNELAIQRVYQMRMLTGRNPNMYDPELGGGATWFRVRAEVPNHNGTYGYYDRVEILDDAIFHAKPVNHADFLYVFMKMRIKPHKVKELQEITDSTYYYGRGGILHSTCGEIEASIATFAIIKMFNHDIRSKLELREYYNSLVKAVLGEYFMNEKKASQLGHNNPYKLPHPVRDAIESYIFSTDGRALGFGALGLIGGGLIGAGLTGGHPAGIIGGAALGGVLGYG